VVAPDRVPAGRRVGQPVALANVASTVLDLAGQAGEPALPGSSLARFWEGPARDSIRSDTIVSVATQNPRQGRLIGLPIDLGPMRSLLVDRWHLIINGDGEEELYDILGDPWEQSNLIPSPEGSAKAAEMRGLLDPRIPPRFTAAKGN
jgi:arylsulfatase A-like enzyme